MSVNPNDYRLSQRRANERAYEWIHDLLIECTAPGTVSHNSAWPDLELQSVYEPAPILLFTYARHAGECGVRRSINAKDMPGDVRAVLPASDRSTTFDVWFVPTDPHMTVIKHRGRDLRALIVTRSIVLVAQLGCNHPDFVVERVVPTYVVQRCTKCDLTYGYDTGD